MNTVAWVFLGGGLGSAARFLVTTSIARLLGQGHPIGTLAVNIMGCLFIGFLTLVFLERMPDAQGARLFAITGFLGGFTTYSAYALDIVTLMQKGETTEALVYALGTMTICVMACIAGMVAARVVLA